MIRPAPVSAADIVEEDTTRNEDSPGEEEEGGGDDVQRTKGLCMNDIKKIIDLGGQLRHLLEQDSTINSDAKCSLITQALAGYEEQYHAHINSLQQRQITDFLRRRTEAQPGPSNQDCQPGPAHLDSGALFANDDDEEEFDGFAEKFLDEMEHRRGGQ